jgi:hypothetical protein
MLRVANLRVERIRQQVELVYGDDVPVSLVAHWRVDLDKSTEVLPLINVLGFVEVTDVGGDLTPTRLLQPIVDRELLANQRRVRRVQHTSIERPDFEQDDALTQPGV